MRTVWSLAVARFDGLHFAVWPRELVRRIVLAGCPPGGTVLDPFVGAGTTIVVAEELGRVGIGIDISAEFLAIARQAVLEAREERAK
jgi:site-specific DNA-methyltransferase (adenine-specific)